MSFKKLGGVAVDKSKPALSVVFFGFLVLSGSIASLERRFLFKVAEVFSARGLRPLVAVVVSMMMNLSISSRDA